MPQPQPSPKLLRVEHYMDASKPQHDLAQSSPAYRSTPTVEELQYHFEGLRSLFLYALIALIGLTLTLDLCFLRKQMLFVRAQLDDQRPKVGKLVVDYKKNTEALVKNFTASLQSFTSSNHDFQPILDKYRPILWPYMVAAPVEPLQLTPGKTPPVPAKQP